MAVQLRYSGILADILDRKHSKCTCPPEYFRPGLSPNKPASNTACCQFGPDCQFLGPCSGGIPVDCQYNQERCTCFTKCTCGPQTQLGPVQLLQGPELDQAINAQTCICAGNCLCKSEESLLPRNNICRPPLNCDKARCTCDVCLCQPNGSESRLLPSDFRNAVKKEANMSTDERIKQECAEIKQLLIEHEESKKKDLEEPSAMALDKGSKKQTMPKVSILEDICPQAQQNDIKEDMRTSIIPQDGLKTPELNVKIAPQEPKHLKEGTRSKKQVFKKEKTPKRKHPKQINAVKLKSATPSQFTQYSCGCRMPQKKPLHVRYYYSGGTEHYGVKLGHKQCLPQPALVPKNMGWLWNIEDPSKGIRERKGWPPGFIAKNIKNMIKVLKEFDEGVDPGVKTHRGDGKRFAARMMEEGEERAEPGEEPPLLHIHKKGRTYNITFCPKSSDLDVGPVPIPFSITEKKQDSDSNSSDSTLEFELHSPKPRLKTNKPQFLAVPKNETEQQDKEADIKNEPSEITIEPSIVKPAKKKLNKKKSLKSNEENKNLWEEQQTQIQDIA